MKAHANLTGFAKATVTAAALGGFLLFAGTSVLRASAESECQERIAKADHRLHQAAAKHGWNSPQAEEKRRDLSAAREHCWEHGHRWWDEDGQRWHTERDWDVHDHDH
jgi:dienelactone hydrolase